MPPPAEVEARAGWVDSVAARAVERPRRRTGARRGSTAVVLHPVLGTLLFAAVMVLFFQLIFAWAEPAMHAIDAAVAAAQGGVRAALPAGRPLRLPRRRRSSPASAR